MGRVVGRERERRVGCCCLLLDGRRRRGWEYLRKSLKRPVYDDGIRPWLAADASRDGVC